MNIFRSYQEDERSGCTPRIHTMQANSKDNNVIEDGKSENSLVQDIVDLSSDSSSIIATNSDKNVISKSSSELDIEENKITAKYGKLFQQYDRWQELKATEFENIGKGGGGGDRHFMLGKSEHPEKVAKTAEDYPDDWEGETEAAKDYHIEMQNDENLKMGIYAGGTWLSQVHPKSGLPAEDDGENQFYKFDRKSWMGSEPGSNFQSNRPGVVDADELTQADIEKDSVPFPGFQEWPWHFQLPAYKARPFSIEEFLYNDKTIPHATDPSTIKSRKYQEIKRRLTEIEVRKKTEKTILEDAEIKTGVNLYRQALVEFDNYILEQASRIQKDEEAE